MATELKPLRRPIERDGLSGGAEKAWHPDLDVQARRVLRQRRGRDLLQDFEIRAGPGRGLLGESQGKAGDRPLRCRFYNSVRHHATLDYVNEPDPLPLNGSVPILRIQVPAPSHLTSRP